MSAIYWDFIEMQHWYWDSKTKRQKDRKIIRQKMMNRTQKTPRRPPINCFDWKRGGGGRGGGSIIKIFWPIELNDLWSKTICRPKMIIWSGATFILRWSFFAFHQSRNGESKVTFLSSLSRAMHPMNPPLKRNKSIFSPKFCSHGQKLPLIFVPLGACGPFWMRALQTKYLSKEVQRTLLIHKKF